MFIKIGLSRVITYPWDTIKTIQQSKECDLLTKRDSKSLNLSDYFRGIAPTVIAAMPANAVFFIGKI
jgi:hypothetical protein